MASQKGNGDGPNIPSKGKEKEKEKEDDTEEITEFHPDGTVRQCAYCKRDCFGFCDEFPQCKTALCGEHYNARPYNGLCRECYRTKPEKRVKDEESDWHGVCAFLDPEPDPKRSRTIGVRLAFGEMGDL